MLEVSCHCGNIIIEAKQALDSVTSCNCSICHRLGALWAYYSAEDVSIHVHGRSTKYRWGRQLRTFHSCPICGCTVHYTQIRDDGTYRVAINTRMETSGIFSNAKVRFFDGAVTFKYI